MTHRNLRPGAHLPGYPPPGGGKGICPDYFPHLAVDGDGQGEVAEELGEAVVDVPAVLGDHLPLEPWRTARAKHV